MIKFIIFYFLFILAVITYRQPNCVNYSKFIYNIDNLYGIKSQKMTLELI